MKSNHIILKVASMMFEKFTKHYAITKSTNFESIPELLGINTWHWAQPIQENFITFKQNMIWYNRHAELLRFIQWWWGPKPHSNLINYGFMRWEFKRIPRKAWQYCQGNQNKSITGSQHTTFIGWRQFWAQWRAWRWQWFCSESTISFLLITTICLSCTTNNK